MNEGIGSNRGGSLFDCLCLIITLSPTCGEIFFVWCCPSWYSSAWSLDADFYFFSNSLFICVSTYLCLLYCQDAEL